LEGRLNLDLALDEPLESVFSLTSCIFAIDVSLDHPLEMLLGVLDLLWIAGIRSSTKEKMGCEMIGERLRYDDR
jgi:hypothetical protein